MSRTGNNSAREVNVFDTFPKERLDYFVMSTPAIHMFLACIYFNVEQKMSELNLNFSLGSQSLEVRCRSHLDGNQ